MNRIIRYFILALTAGYTSSVLSEELTESKITTVCKNGGFERKISVIYKETGQKVPCEVLYEKRDESKVLWSANSSIGYCERKAAAFIEKQKGWGWTCQSESGAEVGAENNASSQVSQQNNRPKIDRLPAVETTEKSNQINAKFAEKNKIKQQLKQAVVVKVEPLESEVFDRAVAAIDTVKEMIEEYYNVYGEYPSDFDQLGVQESAMQPAKLIKRIDIIGKGNIAIKDIDQKTNRTVLTPKPVLGEIIHEWSCQTNIPLAHGSDCTINPNL